MTLHGEMGIASLLKAAGLVESTSEAFRLIAQGAVKIDGEKADDKSLTLVPGFNGIVAVGKRRMARVVLA